MLRALSFRVRVLLVVLAVAVVPLGLVGLWLTRSAARSGEDLLRARLDGALEQTVTALVSRWITQRSSLLDMAEEPHTLAALEGAGAGGDPAGNLAAIFDELDPAVRTVIVRDAADMERWRFERGTLSVAAFPGATLGVGLEARDRRTGRLLGTVEADIQVESLLPVGGVAGAAGMVVGLFDSDGGALLRTPVDPPLLSEERFQWGGDDWLTASRALTDPPIRVVVAAPLTPFAEPFQRASRRGTWVLLIVALAAIAGAGLLMTRLTRALGHLTQAAEAVSKGELGRRVEVHGSDEFGRVAQAFNTMTESLAHTLDRLSSRESLAAVGQFAASLAHEVRNPLTAIRLDLQRVEEALPPDFEMKREQMRALAEIERLNDTVSSTLAAARTGAIREAEVDLRQPFRAAAQAATPAFEAKRAELALDLHDRASPVYGDGGALEQLFLNLFQNAAEALPQGGHARAALSDDGVNAVVEIRDSGSGVPEEHLARVFEPLFTTRPEGTGLGLTIARRIAVAHGGSLVLSNRPEGGARVVVRLPLAEATASASEPGGAPRHVTQ